MLIIQTLLFIIVAPLYTGFVKFIKCLLQNRKSPPIWQPYLNLFKLFRKEVLIATTTSQLFRFAPYIVFGITVFICALIPFADVIVIVGLFALARFFLALAGMDAGTVFGGMGSSREMLISAIAEPALLMVFFSVAMTAGSTNLAVIINQLTLHNLLLQPSIIFAAIGFILVALAETGRIPVDNPDTHLELTMIHEAMILEYSGRYLAFIEWASQLKFLLYAVIFIDIFSPCGFGMLFIKLTILAIILGMTEISLAKLRLFSVPYFLNIAFIFGLLAVLIHIIIEVE